VRDPEETTDVSASRFREAELATTRAAIFDRYRAHSYEEPLDGDDWRCFTPPPLEAYPGYGLAPRDVPVSVPHQRIPGYTD
jgi:hypothetical protein